MYLADVEEPRELPDLPQNAALLGILTGAGQSA
jgi:hypothetical protein